MTNAQHARVVCQAASILLQYPDDTVYANVPVVRAAVSELPEGTSRASLLRFVDHIAATPRRELAEHYVASFDRRQRCCLYLTWWTDGDTRRRGHSLAELKKRYRRGGLDLSANELPDYLPVVLEYAATGDLADGLALLQEYRASVELARLALHDIGSAYVNVLEAVCALLPGPSPADRAAALRLARTGPQRELVGLEPFGVASPGGRR
ncbi:MAG TPA: nitrate reductase molybdenum cofactor assembly chaperone [Actinopolymorphaceae bacterium]|jgi:nitrate reductase delta subunit